MPSDHTQHAPATAPREPEAPVADSGPPVPSEAAPVRPATEPQTFGEGSEAAAIAAAEVEDPAEAELAAAEAAFEAGARLADNGQLAGEAQVGAQAVGEQARLEGDLEQLSARAQMADEYLQLAQRTRADFDNYRKRAARDAATAQERGVAKLARELLSAVDNLDRALEAAQADAPTDGDTLVSGIKLVHADVIAALARVGIERYSPKGEAFDPQCHEAVAQLPVQGAEPGTIVEVYQRGYRIGDNVLRPARVVVAG